MGHGGYGKRRKPKTLTIDKKSRNPKPKNGTIKNQIRSIERMLRRNLPPEVKKAQEQKLEELKKQENDNRLHKIFLRYRKIKFFERRKIERGIRRLEKQQRTLTGQAQEAEIAEQLSKLKEDLEYVRFFPKTEKYVSLFMGGDEAELVEKRNRLREQIKANLVAAAARGKDLEETGSEDDGLFNQSDDDDDFFDMGSPGEAEADDELSAREQASSASGVAAASGMSSDERNQRQISARALMPPPGPSGKTFPGSMRNKSRFAGSSSFFGGKGSSSTSGNKSANHYRAAISTTSSNTSSSISRKRHPMNSTTGNSENLSSNSDARKPRRKRRPKKKKQQA